MRVNPRRYTYCYGCSKDIDDYTLQWLVNVRVSHGRGCFRRMGSIEEYKCKRCGKEQV